MSTPHLRIPRSYPEDAVKFTEDIKERAIKYGFDLVEIVSTETLDAIPSHSHRIYAKAARNASKHAQ